MGASKIMIIEDDTVIRTELKKLLIGNGYDVRAISDFSDPITNMKAYNTAILLAKIASLLKRVYETGNHTDYEWQGAVLHLESSSMEYKGSKVELTKNELKILFFLFKNAGKIRSRNDIVD